MCKQPNGSVSNRNQGGNKQDVTRQQKSQKCDGRTAGKGNGKGATNYQGNVSATSTAARANKGNPRPNRLGSTTPGQSGTSKNGGRDKKGNSRVRLQLPSTSNGSRAGASNSSAGLPGVEVEDRFVHNNPSIWTSTKVRPDLRGTNFAGNYKVDQEQLLVTTWAALILDLCPDMGPIFSELIATRGLDGTIKRFQEIANVLITDSNPTLLDEEIFRVLKQVPLRNALQVLRFGKRYTPLTWSDDMARNVMQKFRARNKRAKLFQRTEMPYWFVKRLKRIGHKIISSALKGRKFEDTLTARSFFVDFHHLPNGTTAEGLKTPFEKWAYISALWSELDPLIAGSIHTRELGTREGVYSKLVLVPKDYRGPRVIMEEQLETVLQQSVVADGLMRIIENSTPPNMPFLPCDAIYLNDQTQNQDLARCGAEFGYHSTLDLKDASDSITPVLIMACLPDIADVILSLATCEVELPDGTHVPLHMPCTMGSRLTVPVQSLVYWVVVCAAAEYLVDMGVIPDLSILKDCRIYNDDIIVPWILDETVRAFLGFAGLVVNDDKSFTDGDLFRESCGVDYYLDNEVTSIYWPRRELRLVNDELPSLCALHNRLYMIGATHATSVIQRYVLGLFPNVPCVMPGDECIGLYSTYTNRQVTPYVSDDVRHVAHASIEVEDRYVHKTLTVTLQRRKYRSSIDLVKVKDLLPLLSDPWIDQVCIYRTGDKNPIECIDPDDIRLLKPIVRRHIDPDLRSLEFPGIYRITKKVIVGAYDNRKTRGLEYDKDIITPKVLSELLEIFEYTRWLLLGSEYYDDLCKWLHVTQPSRIGKSMVLTGYKVNTVTATAFDQSLIESGSLPVPQKREKKKE